MRLLRIGRRLGMVGRRIARACGVCCGGPYSKYVRCGQTDAVYVHDSVLCGTGQVVNTFLPTVLYAGYCWSRVGPQKFTIAELPQGATLISSGVLQCVAGGCSAIQCNTSAYVESYPCVRNTAGAGRVQYVPAAALNGKPVYRPKTSSDGIGGGWCASGPSLPRSAIPAGEAVASSNLVLFNSCCEVHCTPNRPGVPNCCCNVTDRVPAVGSYVYEFWYANRLNPQWEQPPIYSELFVSFRRRKTYTATSVLTVVMYPQNPERNYTDYRPYGLIDSNSSACSDGENVTPPDSFVYNGVTSVVSTCRSLTVTRSGDTYDVDSVTGQPLAREYEYGSWTYSYPSNICNECTGGSASATTEVLFVVGHKETAGDLL